MMTKEERYLPTAVFETELDNKPVNVVVKMDYDEDENENPIKQEITVEIAETKVSESTIELLEKAFEDVVTGFDYIVENDKSFKMTMTLSEPDPEIYELDLRIIFNNFLPLLPSMFSLGKLTVENFG